MIDNTLILVCLLIAPPQAGELDDLSLDYLLSVDVIETITKNPETLFIQKVAVDKGEVFKRFMPRARGSASRINKRNSNNRPRRQHNRNIPKI